MSDEIIRRLENGEGADRELDHDICRALGLGNATGLVITGSLDAAIALVEKMRPTWTIDVCISFTGCVCSIRDDWTEHEGISPSAPRALLIALLRSLDKRA